MRIKAKSGPTLEHKADLAGYVTLCKTKRNTNASDKTSKVRLQCAAWMAI